MAVINDTRFLSTMRLNRIVQTQADALRLRRPLIYREWVPLVPAFEDELMGRFTGTIHAADIIINDQQAVTQKGQLLEVYTNKMPNLKTGIHLTQAELIRMDELSRGAMSVQGENAMRDWEQRMVENGLLAVRMRENMLAVSMLTDSLIYNRLGVIIGTAATWGMPAELKVTPSVLWSVPATATPIDDMMAQDQVMTDNYGQGFNHVTMSSRAFRAMVATTDFQAKASLSVGVGFQLAAGNLTLKADAQMQTLAQNILGKTIQLDDSYYTVQTNDGTAQTFRYLPINKVLLTRREDHGDSNVYDMANGPVTEAIVAGLTGGVEGLTPGERGPVAYWTGRQDLNPPDVTAWFVSRSFPRKHEPTSSSVLTVGPDPWP